MGRLKEGITKAELRRRFEAFGPVVDISIHFRERGLVSILKKKKNKNMRSFLVFFSLNQFIFSVITTDL